MTTFILVADAAQARLYSWQKGGSLAAVREYSHPEGRAHESELGSDKPGRTRQSSGSRAALEPHTPRHKVEMEKFARELAGTLEKSADAAERVVLVAGPAFLGVLREQLSARVQA